MKRISLVIVLSMLAPALCQASRYSSQRYRVRYSPYAFNYHNNGLIPGGVRYSPYAFKSGNSGLVYEGTRYTPYAFNYNNPGLVVDYYLWHAPVSPTCQVYAVDTTHHVARAPRRRPAPRRAARYAAASPRRHNRGRANDTHKVVTQYLKGRGIDNVDTTRRLSVRNRIAGIAFILRDKDLVIRYSNPEVVEAFAAESKTSRKVLQRYEQRWETFAKAFEAKGGTVYRIDTADRDQIVAALNNCGSLAPDTLTPAPTRLYAKD